VPRDGQPVCGGDYAPEHAAESAEREQNREAIVRVPFFEQIQQGELPIFRWAIAFTGVLFGLAGIDHLAHGEIEHGISDEAIGAGLYAANIILKKLTF
jgi:hypothetical protein